MILLILATTLAAQSLTLTGPATARPGQPVTLTLTLAGAPAPAGIQWTLVVPAGYVITAVADGAQTVAAGKSAKCGATNQLCLVYGMNQNVIASGPVAQIAVTVSPQAPPGFVAFPLMGLLAGTKTGTSQAISQGAAYTLSIVARSDLNGDGITDSADVTLMVVQVTAGACTDDQNGDGRCDLLDVLGVVLRALGF